VEKRGRDLNAQEEALRNQTQETATSDKKVVEAEYKVIDDR
jgi:hypothetical protein